MVTQYDNIKVRFEYDMMRDLWRIWAYLPPVQIHKPMHISMYPVDSSKDAIGLAADIEYIEPMKVGGTITSEMLYHGGYAALGALFENGDWEHPVINREDVAYAVMQAAKNETQQNYDFLASMTGSAPAPESSMQNQLALAKKNNQNINWGGDLPKAIPGLYEFVEHPVEKIPSLIFNIIQDLNDNHKWSRERVADWLDTLDVDLSFPMDDKDGQ